MKSGTKLIEQYDLTSLRVLGSVGEPINPEVRGHDRPSGEAGCAHPTLTRDYAPYARERQAWRWYHDHVGRGRCAIVDTFWQTETGAIMITPLPGATPAKPGSATLPFFGIVPVILDPHSGKLLEGNDVSGVLAFARPWPSMARSVHGDHDRFLTTYLRPYPGTDSSEISRGCSAARPHDQRNLQGSSAMRPLTGFSIDSRGCGRQQGTTLRATARTAMPTATTGSVDASMVCADPSRALRAARARGGGDPSNAQLIVRASADWLGRRHQRVGPPAWDCRDRVSAGGAQGLRRGGRRRRPRRHDRVRLRRRPGIARAAI